jgi:hypothetical protein
VDSSFPHKFSADFEGGEKDRFNNNMAGLALNFIPQKEKIHLLSRFWHLLIMETNLNL